MRFFICQLKCLFEPLSDDFVAFKLDIDTPEVEIPVALEILKDSHSTGLIDEVFFTANWGEFSVKCYYDSYYQLYNKDGKSIIL
jgi:hypothetical protein